MVIQKVVIRYMSASEDVLGYVVIFLLRDEGQFGMKRGIALNFVGGLFDARNVSIHIENYLIFELRHQGFQVVLAPNFCQRVVLMIELVKIVDFVKGRKLYLSKKGYLVL
jgi:hypothetical protein